MPCREFKVDKRSQGPVFEKYAHLKGRVGLHARYMRHLLPQILSLKGRVGLHARYMSHLLPPILSLKGRVGLHARYMHHLLPPILFLKGRTSLRMRDMRHLPLLIWDEITTFHVKRIPFLPDKRRSLQKIR